MSDFANKGDKIGDITFDKDGKYSKHDLSFNQIEGKEKKEGQSDTRLGRGLITFDLKINKDMSNPLYNIPETIGHEAFLHLKNGMDELIKAYEKNGTGAALELLDEDQRTNTAGYLDHLSVKDDKGGRAKRYYEYITQLKTVLNPTQVQNHVNKEVDKTYNFGAGDKRRYKK